MNTEFVVAIPSRIGSSRFPRKPLVLLAGKPVIAHVIARAQEAGASRVLVATDDEQIAAVASECGAEAVMTPADVANGTLRVELATRHLDDDTCIVNVQGDEPLASPQDIAALAACTAGDDTAFLCSIYAELTQPEQLNDPNVVKVVLGQHQQALYFSRAAIPYQQASGAQVQKLKHLGMYGYKRKNLAAYVNLPTGELEVIESLEQLRILEQGHLIRMVKSVDAISPPSIDTPKDLEAAEEWLAQCND